MFWKNHRNESKNKPTFSGYPLGKKMNPGVTFT